MSSQPVFRFAPSPNGYLHLGHAYSALFTRRAAQAIGGITLLRIEDIDPGRSKPHFEQAIYDDLRWLGYAFPEPVMRQSERLNHYETAAGLLRKIGLIYPCFCSRTDVAAAATGTDPEGGALYPGTCRHLSATEINARLRAGAPVQWRLKMEEAQEEIGDVLVVRECPVDDR
ncbi:MAG TPA: tRNA glutamyl-Q(34) synthetase GluQRS, partial [Alphaproteobacteria bacterium]|nr:tRNA glutamyl-Q(34) synthetase GluQRS [Alphaproteobacteria bacterium]